FVIGDLASLKGPHGPVPGVAAAAIQEGRHTAMNLSRALRGLPLRDFHYVDKGSLATIGRAAAVADLGTIKLSGFIAWMTWLVVHVIYLVGYRSRVSVLLEWAWAYITHERGARLLTGTPEREAPAIHAPRPRPSRYERVTRAP